MTLTEDQIIVERIMLPGTEAFAHLYRGFAAQASDDDDSGSDSDSDGYSKHRFDKTLGRTFATGHGDNDGDLNNQPDFDGDDS